MGSNGRYGVGLWAVQIARLHASLGRFRHLPIAGHTSDMVLLYRTLMPR
jgi:hypothetical protein